MGDVECELNSGAAFFLRLYVNFFSIRAYIHSKMRFLASCAVVVAAAVPLLAGCDAEAAVPNADSQCGETNGPSEEPTDRERYLMRKLEAATEEVRRQVKIRARQVSGSCSDRAGVQHLAGEQAQLRVGSYNLWNLNQNWPLRQRGMQSMLSYLKPDVIAVQEIRWLPGQEWPAGHEDEPAESDEENSEEDDSEGENLPETQSVACEEDFHVHDHKCVRCPDFEFNTAGDEPSGDDTECVVRYNSDGSDPRLDAREAQLVSLAASSGYEHYTIRSAAAAARAIGANWSAPGGFDEEAVGLLSRHPIVDTQELPLPPPWDAPDRNPRVILAPLINVTGVGLVRVFSSHLSYEKMEQCRTVPLLRKFADSLWVSDRANFGEGRDDFVVPQLIVGDLNTYFDFEWPFDILTEPAGHLMRSPLHPCAAQFHDSGVQLDGSTPAFGDAWESVKPSSDPGYTFPNPETSNSLPPARCDRILFRGFDALLDDALVPNRAAVVGCEPLGMSGIHMSDHRFVVADFLSAR